MKGIAANLGCVTGRFADRKNVKIDRPGGCAAERLRQDRLS